MSRFLREQISRRRLLTTAGGAVVGGSLALRRLAARAQAPPGPIRVLVHDEAHDGAAFSRGRLQGLKLDQQGRGALRGRGAFESPVMESPFPFTHAGLHWKADGWAADEPRFEIRTSSDGGAWSPWQATGIEARPEETPRRETFASLLESPRHRYLQYRLRLGGGAGISAVTCTFINSVDGPVTEGASGATAAIAAKPIDFTREGWGADESIRFDQNGEIWPPDFVPVKKLIVHHTDGSNNYTNAAAIVRSIYAYHTQTLGWGDIGYNALVDRFGNSYEGRHGRVDAQYGVDYHPGSSREIFSRDVVAGHALDHNHGSCGVSLIGNFEVAQPPLVMLARLVDVLAWVARGRGIDPRGVSDFLRVNNVWTRALGNVCGHRDCNSTDCPGRHVYAALPAIRDLVADRIARSGPSVRLISGPDGRGVDGGKLAYRWHDPSGQATAYSYYLEGWSRFGRFRYLSGYTHDRLPRWSSWSSATSAALVTPADGHYTIHVRSRDAAGAVSVYEANRTVLMDVEEEEMAAINELRSQNQVAGMFVQAASYVMRGDALPAGLSQQIRYLLALASASTAGANGGGEEQIGTNEVAASLFLQAASHGLAGTPMPSNLRIQVSFLVG